MTISDSAASLPQTLRDMIERYRFAGEVETALRSAADALERAREVLDLFRYAHAWVSADSWDWTVETRGKFQDAAALADSHFGKLSDDEIARIGQRHASLSLAPERILRQDQEELRRVIASLRELGIAFAYNDTGPVTTGAACGVLEIAVRHLEAASRSLAPEPNLVQRVLANTRDMAKIYEDTRGESYIITITDAIRAKEAADTIEGLSAAREAVLAAWQPIETAPLIHSPPISPYTDDGPTILLWYPSWGSVRGYWSGKRDTGAWWYSCHSGRILFEEKPTHWKYDEGPALKSAAGSEEVSPASSAEPPAATPS